MGLNILCAELGLERARDVAKSSKAMGVYVIGED